jgi:hypothetical protein
MALESGTYISDLVSTNPAGSDAKSTLDDHIRLIKAVILATFPNINGAMTATEEQLNALGAGDLDNAALIGIKQIGFEAEYDNGNSGASKTVTLANAQKQKITLTANTTLTFDFTGAKVGTYQLRLIQDATGSRTLTWSGLTSTRWLGATSAPTINSTANGETIVNIFAAAAGVSTGAVQSMSKVGAV